MLGPLNGSTSGECDVVIESVSECDENGYRVNVDHQDDKLNDTIDSNASAEQVAELSSEVTVLTRKLNFLNSVSFSTQ